MKPNERFRRLLERYKDDPEYLAEGVLIDITEQIASLLESAGMNRSEFAQKLNCSNAYVTKLLNGSENLTIRKLSQIAQAFRCSLHVAFVPGKAQARAHPAAVANRHVALSKASFNLG